MHGPYREITTNTHNMPDPDNAAPNPSLEFRGLVSPLQYAFKRVMAGNPFYLASAGFLLYGINQLTTDPKLVGAEFAMLRFNFGALLLYEMMLVCTAIALFRRKIWYDATLLFGLANLFVIVPFSLITRAVFLSPNLALAMTVLGAGLAVAKFWAFKQYAPELNLSRRLLAFGSVLLLVNACAPLLFKKIANDLDQVANGLNFIWLFVLPALAGLGVFLPRPVDSSVSPERKRWLPVAVFLAWVLVTACHVGGIGYSTSYVWNYSLLVPVAWIVAWTIWLRVADFVAKPSQRLEGALLFVPLLLPLLAMDSERIQLFFAGLNLVVYGSFFVRNRRDLFSLIRLLGATAIFCEGLPVGWIGHVVPGITHAEWILLSILVCFFWLIFRSRDPRVALFSTLGLIVSSFWFAPDFSRYAVQLALVSFLAHSLRWDDQAHKGAAMLRILIGALWVLISCSWLFEPVQFARWLVDPAASLLLTACLLHAIVTRSRGNLFVLAISMVVLLSEPVAVLTGWFSKVSGGVVAIITSFILFALGTAAAFTKPKWWRLS